MAFCITKENSAANWILTQCFLIVCNFYLVFSKSYCKPLRYSQHFSSSCSEATLSQLASQSRQHLHFHSVSPCGPWVWVVWHLHDGLWGYSRSQTPIQRLWYCHCHSTTRTPIPSTVHLTASRWKHRPLSSHATEPQSCKQSPSCQHLWVPHTLWHLRGSWEKNGHLRPANWDVQENR